MKVRLNESKLESFGFGAVGSWVDDVLGSVFLDAFDRVEDESGDCQGSNEGDSCPTDA